MTNQIQRNLGQQLGRRTRTNDNNGDVNGIAGRDLLHLFERCRIVLAQMAVEVRKSKDKEEKEEWLERVKLYKIQIEHFCNMHGHT